eukprot:g2835.t2
MSFTKRERSGYVDRDANELQHRRLNARQTHNRGTSWRNPRRSPDFNEGFPNIAPLSMEFDIQPDMVGAVIGKGGTTAKAIRNRTGANVHVHAPTTENPRTFVELRGRRDQIDAAYDELRAVISSVDEDFAKQMQASITLRTKPETVGCLIGKQGQNIKQIEDESGARVRVEPHEEGAEFQSVHVSGDVGSVEYATQLVQESLERYDATRQKKQNPIPMNSHCIQQPKAAPELKPMIQEPLQQPKTDTAVPPLLIQAPEGGFAPRPAVLVLQADGMYHPAQVVTAYEGGGGSGGGTNSPGLVTVVAQHPTVLSSIPTAAAATGGGGVSQPQIVDTSGQRMLSTLYSTPGLATTALPQGTQQQQQQGFYQLKPSGAGVGGGGSALVPQLTAANLATTQAQVPQANIVGNQPMPLLTDSFIHQQQQHQQQPQQQSMQVYDYTMTGANSQAIPDLNTLSSLLTMRFDPNLAAAAAAAAARQQVPVSMTMTNSTIPEVSD